MPLVFILCGRNFTCRPLAWRVKRECEIRKFIHIQRIKLLRPTQPSPPSPPSHHKPIYTTDGSKSAKAGRVIFALMHTNVWHGEDVRLTWYIRVILSVVVSVRNDIIALRDLIIASVSIWCWKIVNLQIGITIFLGCILIWWTT